MQRLQDVFISLLSDYSDFKEMCHYKESVQLWSQVSPQKLHVNCKVKSCVLSGCAVNKCINEACV